jgi:hypothetical protein
MSSQVPSPLAVQFGRPLAVKVRRDHLVPAESPICSPLAGVRPVPKRRCMVNHTGTSIEGFSTIRQSGPPSAPVSDYLVDATRIPMLMQQSWLFRAASDTGLRPVRSESNLLFRKGDAWSITLEPLSKDSQQSDKVAHHLRRIFDFGSEGTWELIAQHPRQAQMVGHFV